MKVSLFLQPKSRILRFYLTLLPLKKILAIGLLLLYINSNSELHELLRLPVLFEHFAEHKKLVGDISFWEFLSLHYSTNVSHDAHDNQLPFKDINHSFSVSIFVMPLSGVSLKDNYFVASVTHDNAYQGAYFTSPLCEIFQPPKG